ncbi:MAG: hypothetical protein Q8O98_01655 [bacterium]|nr:hypothetical protein [bacterium]
MNDFENRESNRNKVIILVIVAALLIFGFLIYKGFGKVVNDSVDRSTVITGAFSCLPPKPDAGPTRGCVLGLQARGGSYYALDVSRIQDANTDLKADDLIAVTGFIRPADSSQDWAEYDIKAVILVNTLLRTR